MMYLKFLVWMCFFRVGVIYIGVILKGVDILINWFWCRVGGMIISMSRLIMFLCCFSCLWFLMGCYNFGVFFRWFIINCFILDFMGLLFFDFFLIIFSKGARLSLNWKGIFLMLSFFKMFYFLFIMACWVCDWVLGGFIGKLIFFIVCNVYFFSEYVIGGFGCGNLKNGGFWVI